MKLSVITLCLLLSSAAFANVAAKEEKVKPVRAKRTIKLAASSQKILGKKLTYIIENIKQSDCDSVRKKMIKEINQSSNGLKLVEVIKSTRIKSVVEIDDTKRDKTILLTMRTLKVRNLKKVKPRRKGALKCSLSPKFK